LITPTLRVILKAFGYTVALLVGTFISAEFVWAVTGSRDLGGLAFWSGLFLGVLAVLASELDKHEALVLQQTHEQTAVAAPPNAPILTQYVPGTFQVSTKTIVDLNLSIFGLKLALCTDLERSKCVLSQDASIHLPSNQITLD
jgi:hypothetical protein